MRLLLTNEQLETLNELEVEDELVFMPESSESLIHFYILTVKLMNIGWINFCLQKNTLK